MTILDRISKPEQLTPATTEEFVALQIAKRLKDLENAGWYLHRAGRHGANGLIQAFQKCSPAAPGAAERFRSLLQH